MKYFTYIFILLLAVSSCQSGGQEEQLWPEDLAGKRALLKEKRSAMKTLTDEVTRLEKEIAALDPTAAAEKAPLVTTGSVERKTFTRFVDIQAKVEATDVVNVAAETSGRLLKVTVDEGERVRKGQLIAEIDLEQLEKQMAELETSLELANTLFERQQRLWKQNIGSEIQFLEAKNNKERLEKSIETLKFQMTKGMVYAPISGVVDRVNLEPGELASAGMPIIEVLNTNRLKVVADVPENYLQSVSRGQMIKVEYPSLDIEQDVRITLIGSTIDEANRTFKVEANVGNPGGKLKPNLLASVLLKESEEQDVVVLPLDLVQQEVGGKRFVMIKDSGAENIDIARKVYVQIGESYDGEIIITDGLKGGETIIKNGSRGLADKQPIRIQDAKTVANNE